MAIDLCYAAPPLAGWELPPRGLGAPDAEEVHVWRACISSQKKMGWQAILSTEERERALRFRTECDRERFMATRGLLRDLLGGYLNVRPETLNFVHNRFGKPSLESSTGFGRLTFNVSHSGDYSLLAFAIDVDVGVDIEHSLVERDFAGLAKRLLGTRRYSRWSMMPEAERREELLTLWTRREAIGKMLGFGTSVEPDWPEDQHLRGSQWSICRIDAPVDYVATLAVRARNAGVRLWVADPDRAVRCTR